MPRYTNAKLLKQLCMCALYKKAQHILQHVSE